MAKKTKRAKWASANYLAVHFTGELSVSDFSWKELELGLRRGTGIFSDITDLYEVSKDLEAIATAEWCEMKLKRLGAEVTEFTTAETVDDMCAPLLLGSVVVKEGLPTIGIYCWMEPKISNLWRGDYDINEHKEKDAMNPLLRALGSKASLLIPLAAVYSYISNNASLPFNCKFIIDPVPRRKQNLLRALLDSVKDEFLSDISHFVSFINTQEGLELPSVVCTMKGLNSFRLEIEQPLISEGANRDRDLVLLLHNIVNDNDVLATKKIQVQGKRYLWTREKNAFKLSCMSTRSFSHLNYIPCKYALQDRPGVKVMELRKGTKVNDLICIIDALYLPPLTPCEVSNYIFRHLSHAVTSKGVFAVKEVKCLWNTWPWSFDTSDEDGYRATLQAVQAVFGKQIVTPKIIEEPVLSFPLVIRDLLDKNVTVISVHNCHDSCLNIPTFMENVTVAAHIFYQLSHHQVSA